MANNKKILSISNNVKIFYSKYIPRNLEEFKNKKLIAFAGIGNPDNFFNLKLTPSGRFFLTCLFTH